MSNGAPVNLVPLGQRANRELFAPPVGPDRFEDFH
jgi:hypothetical protein